MGPIFLRRTLIGVFQYCGIMPLITLLSLLSWSVPLAARCHLFLLHFIREVTAAPPVFARYYKVDGFGEFDPRKAYPYLAFVQVQGRGQPISALNGRGAGVCQSQRCALNRRHHRTEAR